MNIEHFAFMAENPAAVAAWYVEHLGFSIKRSMDTQPWMHFSADSGDNVMIEIYNNPIATLPDYASMHPLLMHLALASEDPEADRDRLVKAGASVDTDLEVTPAGDRLVMLRDPWGLSLQLCCRAKPML